MKHLPFIILFLFGSLHTSFAKIDWYDSLEEAQAVAQAQGKFILIDFWAAWCGPCKKMDSEVWNQSEMEALAGRYVAAKINVDYDRATATRYNTKGIPFMLITDPYGEVLYETVGYKGFVAMKGILEMFPGQIGNVHTALAQFQANNKDAQAALYAALQYQELAMKTPNETGRRVLLGESSNFFAKAKKLGKDDTFSQKVALLKTLAWVVKEKPAKTIEEVNKIGMDNVLPENQVAALYVMAYAHFKNGDKDLAAGFVEKLKAMQQDSPYLAQLEGIK